MTFRFRSSSSAFFRDTSGAATLEFVVLVPFLMIVVFMFAEIGILAGRTVLLKRGVNIAARDIRLGDAVDQDAFRATACANAFLINSCITDLRIEMIPHDVAARQDPTTTIYCPNRFPDPGEPVVPFNDFQNGVDGNIMIIKACLIVDPVFPGVGLAAGLNFADGQGYAIIAKSAVMIECDDEDECV